MRLPAIATVLLLGVGLAVARFARRVRFLKGPVAYAVLIERG